jgi:hypothetical protein
LVLLLELQKYFNIIQIKTIFCWTIISFICALISQQNVRLGHKPSSIAKFQWILFFKMTMMHEIGISTENYQILKLEWPNTHQCTSLMEPIVGFVNWMKLCFLRTSSLPHYHFFSQHHKPIYPFLFLFLFF